MQEDSDHLKRKMPTRGTGVSGALYEVDPHRLDKKTSVPGCTSMLKWFA